jgi:hypothetical protein
MSNATFYIWNTKTDESFDTNENRFYGSNWEVELEEKSYLESVMANDPERFIDCKIVDINN